MRSCASCSADISHKRRDARFCDRACKARASEQRRPPRDNAARYLRERDRRLTYAKVRYELDAEACRARSRDWRANNPHRRRSQRDRRADLIESHPDYRPFPASEWERLKRRHGHRCAYCGEKPDALEMDHVVPISRGGRHAIANILPACKPCNVSKYNHLLVEWRSRPRRR